jgi:hypothetical protein
MMMMGLIRVKVRIEEGGKERIQEVARGTQAIELLKNEEGVRQAIFAKVKYAKGV